MNTSLDPVVGRSEWIVGYSYKASDRPRRVRLSGGAPEKRRSRTLGGQGCGFAFPPTGLLSNFRVARYLARTSVSDFGAASRPYEGSLYPVRLLAGYRENTSEQ